MIDIFVQIDGIEGESLSVDHEKWIKALGYNHGLAQPHATAASGGGSYGGISRAEHEDFKISKFLDKASPKLNLQCQSGKLIPKVVVHICRQVDSNVVYQKYELEGVIVRSVAISGSSVSLSNDTEVSLEKPIENVAFAYKKITLTYTEVNEKNKAAGDTMAWLDPVTNTCG